MGRASYQNHNGLAFKERKPYSNTERRDLNDAIRLIREALQSDKDWQFENKVMEAHKLLRNTLRERLKN